VPHEYFDQTGTPYARQDIIFAMYSP